MDIENTFIRMGILYNRSILYKLLKRMWGINDEVFELALLIHEDFKNNLKFKTYTNLNILNKFNISKLLVFRKPKAKESHLKRINGKIYCFLREISLQEITHEINHIFDHTSFPITNNDGKRIYITNTNDPSDEDVKLFKHLIYLSSSAEIKARTAECYANLFCAHLLYYNAEPIDNLNFLRSELRDTSFYQEAYTLRNFDYGFLLNNPHIKSYLISVAERNVFYEHHKSLIKDNKNFKFLRSLFFKIKRKIIKKQNTNIDIIPVLEKYKKHFNKAGEYYMKKIFRVLLAIKLNRRNIILSKNDIKKYFLIERKLKTDQELQEKTEKLYERYLQLKTKV